jgi:glyoxylase-like metal-dependent hydrolase (beta-lactamase superfamily II)
VLPDRSPARNHDLGYRRNFRQRLQGWRLAPEKLNAFTVDRPLLPQLAAIGYTPADITYLALSHYHGDHVANASLFAKSTWIVQRGDRDPILAPRPAGSRVPDPKFFEGLADSKTVLLNGEDHDVFGDGTVVIKSTPGHTPGHQSLFLKLANTGNVLLSGDLYHYPEEITYKKIPSFDTSKEETAKSRGMIEEFVKQNHAQLWIQHDYTSGIGARLLGPRATSPRIGRVQRSVQIGRHARQYETSDIVARRYIGVVKPDRWQQRPGKHENCKHAFDCAHGGAFSCCVGLTDLGSSEGRGSREERDHDKMSRGGSQPLSRKVL